MFVGDVDTTVYNEAYSFSSDAKRLDQYIPELNTGVYYLSLGDYTRYDDFVNTLMLADKIVFCPPTLWSSNSIKNSTEITLTLLSTSKIITGLDKISKSPIKESLKNLADIRKIDGSQIWNAGCSISHGIGVQENEKYGSLISKKLNLPISFLTNRGSSIEWASDQILQSDIRKGDIVIWGLTSLSRFPFFTNEKVNHVLTSYYENNPKFNNTIPIDILSHEHLNYQAAKSITQVKNFCNKIGAKLILANILASERLILSLLDAKDYVQLQDISKPASLYLDLGTDNLHPGPKQHKLYAEKILNFYENQST